MSGHLSTRTQLLIVFRAIFFRYFSLKNHSITTAIKGFLKKNYRKNLSPKIIRINMSEHLSARTYLIMIYFRHAKTRRRKVSISIVHDLALKLPKIIRY